MASQNGSQPSSSCRNDNSFGPFVVGCRDNFDFTELFEQSILSILPSSLFLLLAIARLIYLARQPVVLGGRPSKVFQGIKAAAIVAYVGIQAASLALAATGAVALQRTTIAAASLSLASACVALVLSAVEHSRTYRPSALLSVYFFLSLLFYIAQTRTYWLSEPTSSFTKVFTASVATKTAVLLLEAQSKRSFIDRRDGSPSPSPEQTSGVFNHGLFFWLNKLLFRGYRKPLLADDLYTLDQELAAEKYQKVFWDSFQQGRQQKRNRPLLRSIGTVLRGPLVIPVAARLAVGAFSFAQPFFINAVLGYLQEDAGTSPDNIGYGFIGAAILIYAGLGISTALYWYFHERMLARLRACLVTAIYRKTVHNKSSAEENSSAITLMNSDVMRIQGGLRDLHECWASIIETAIASWLLWRQIGAAFVSPIVIILICMGLTFTVAKFAGKRQGQWMALLQKRVALTTAIIPNLPAIKMSALEKQLGRLVQLSRVKEVDGAKRFRMLTAVTAAIAFAPLLLSPVVTFAIGRDHLNIQTAFTSVGFINLLCSPLTQVFQSVPQLLSAITCLERVEKYLSSDSSDNDNASSSPEKAGSKTSLETGSGRDTLNSVELLKIENGKFGWKKDEWALENIDISIARSSFTVITGPVASGKSSLCKALLGESPYAEGRLSFDRSAYRSAYSDQDPYIFNATVKDNIVGYETLNTAWYDEVLKACHLTQDLESLPQGDQTLTGSKGVALSGGQKKRICLARAVYSRPDLAILDDIFGGIDNKTANLIFRDVFGSAGLLRKMGTTVVFTAQSAKRASAFDQLVVLSDKSISYQGPPDKSEATKESIGQDVEKSDDSSSQSSLSEPQKAEAKSPSGDKKDQEKPNAVLGGIANYKFYFQAIGPAMLILWCVFSTGFAFFFNFSTVWLDFWQSSDDPQSRESYYLGIYFMLEILGLILLALFVAYGGILMSPRASLKLHVSSLTTLLQAPLEYYTAVDSSVPIGYFAQDMTLIDTNLSGSLDNTMLTGLTAVGQAAIIAIASPYILIGYPILIALLFTIQKFYLRTSRRLRLLAMETKEPLYKHFNETVDGLLSIRAFKWVEASMDQNAKLLDESQRSTYLLAMLQQWLNLVLNMSVAVIAVVFVVLATQLRTSAGFTGVGLVGLMSFGEMMGNMIRCYTELQNATVGLTRLRGFRDQVKDEDLGNGSSGVDYSWPQSGELSLHGVSAAYSKDNPFLRDGEKSSNASPISLAVKDVSVSIGAGEKILVCGRTGSGKSSLLLILQGLLKPSSGQIWLDDLDVNSIGGSVRRNRIITLPQVPFFLPDDFSIRENLEYHGGDSSLDHDYLSTQDTAPSQDAECEEALRSVGLWDLFQSKGGLDAKLRDASLSRGQKQLLSLARAIVRIKLRQKFSTATGSATAPPKGGLLLLDEFNTGLDAETEKMVWGAIRREFASFTIVCVAHSFEAIGEFDKAVMMSNGRVERVGKPQDVFESAE